MKAWNKLLCSIIMYSIMSYILELPDYSIGLLYAAIGSQLNFLLPSNYKNSLIPLLPLMLLAPARPSIAIPVIIGYLSAILISLLSESGCKLLYPIRKTTFIGPKNYMKKGNTEKAATVFLLVLAILAVTLSCTGETLIENANSNTYIDQYFSNGYQQSYNRRYNSNGTDTAAEGGIQYVNIDPSTTGVNKNVTTTVHREDNNTTTTETIIREYTPPATNTT